MDKIKIKTIRAFSEDEFDKKIASAINNGYINVSDLVVVARIGKEDTDFPFAFFQTYVWYPQKSITEVG